MSALPTQPQSIGKNLDAGIKLYLRGLGKVLPIAFIVSVLGVFPNLIQTQPGLIGAGDPSSIAVIMIAYMIVMIVLGITIYGGMIKYYGDLAKGGSPTIAGSLKRGFSKIFPILFATIIYLIAVMIGSILLLIPGIILMLSMSLYTVAIILDNKGFFESIKFSHSLVWGNWWRTLTIFTVPLLLMMGLYFILMIIIGANITMIAGVSTGGLDQAAFMQTMLWFTLGSAVVNALVYPLLYAVTVVLYHDLKLRKGGGDLEARLAGA